MNSIINTQCVGMERFNKYIERCGMEKKSYQYEGVEWLLKNELRNVNGDSDSDGPAYRGGFVADEMGLGKTIMMIGLCLANFMPRTLIVLPPVLIDQWFAQIYRTTGHKCVIYHGENKKKISDVGVAGLENSVIVLCSYDAITITRERKNNKNNTKKSVVVIKKPLDSSLLHKIKWGRVIFDEAHHLRNKNTGRYVGAKLLNSDIKWLVSGTPIQNKKQDFYALCSLIHLPASYYTDSSNLMEITHNHILKRTKKQVGICLDDAIEKKQIVDWANIEEMKLSEKIHSMIGLLQVKTKEKKVVHENGDGNEKIEITSEMGARIGGGGGGGGGSAFGTDLLALLLRARQSCVYPKMMENKFTIETEADDINKVEAMGSTSKLDSVVHAILERKNNGNGKIVFCHFKEEMREIAERLSKVQHDENGLLLRVAILDGKTSKSVRSKILSEKNDVLIMQIQTGCEGLNLQDNYNEIYFVSPHWNPYIEDQAVARCHRIGQKKEVFVWRFEMNNFDTSQNLEEYVTEIQNGKRDMVSKLLYTLE